MDEDVDHFRSREEEGEEDARNEGGEGIVKGDRRRVPGSREGRG